MRTSVPSKASRAVRPAATLPPRKLLTAAVAAALLVACGGSDKDDGDADRLGELHGSTRTVSVDFTEGTNMAPTPSPDGTRIAFTAQGALWVIPSAGGTAKRLTRFDIEPTHPVWSPDGKLIAFQNYTRDGNWHIWSIEPDGANAKELTTGFFDDREPAWTPDGTALVFASDRSDDGQYKIWRYTLATGTYTQLTRGAGAESNPVVSPDGRQIAFVEAAQAAPLPVLPARVFTAPVDGSAAPTLVAPGSMPAYGANGGLVYQSTSTTLNIGGRDAVTGEDLFPFPVRPMANGRLLYAADGKLRTRDAAGAGLAEVPFKATLEVRRPVQTKSKDRHFNELGQRTAKGISAPAISPDGQSIAFVALNDVWVMRIGQTPVRLTNDTDRDGNVQWTADGAAVYFSTERGNGGALAIDQVTVATKARRRLAAIPGKSMVSPKMSPNGDRIAYTALSGQLEVWNVASNSASLVMPQVSTQLSTPQWTPDGSRIMLVDNQRINNRFREGYNKLRVIDVAAKTDRFYPVAEAPRQVSDREEGAAVLSPDGKTVALIIDSVLNVMPVNADGSPAGAARAITTEVADLPSWAGDSNTILYKSADRIKTIQSDGSNAREIAINVPWTQAVGPATTIVHAGALWDGVNQALRSNVDIVISGNRITAIRPHQADAQSTATRFVDASGLTVIPGLWDPHIHPLTLYQGGQYGQIAALMLSYGITSTQSVAGPLHQSVEMRESIEAGNLLGPRLFICPPLWEGNRQFYSFARTLRTPQIADMEIAKATRMDVDFLKSYVRAPIPIMQKIAQAALDNGIQSGTHMLSPGAATGLGGTTHLSATQRMGYGWSKSANLITYQDAYDLHAKAAFYNIDTIFSSTALVGADPSMTNDDRFRYLVPPNFVAGLQSTPAPSTATLAGIRRDAEQSAKVQRAGGLLALGTDSPLVTPGISLHTNVRAGAMVYSNHQALQNVTINAAKVALVDKDLGSIEVGKLADLVAVRGNPLTDIKAAAAVEVVVKNGITYTLPQILAPFRTPQALAERKKALESYARMCHAKGECEVLGHAH
ncbi:amidohydrolase family protein [Piscinibacter koreensis]|uniref:PD40 domain-containing protein n=1 Tax=Piscinibacter koreensis TaxID=2742824 RepID=A0A7Y6NJH7_9BURK|nr:amidohydrolase family protein [Schlegelella koreensis]NUZ04241.1 PD40 domain-containing protein [Schlegelella koreensis]